MPSAKLADILPRHVIASMFQHPVYHPARGVPEFIITSTKVRTPDRRTLQSLRHAYGYLLRRHSIAAVIGSLTGSVTLSLRLDPHCRPPGGHPLDEDARRIDVREDALAPCSPRLRPHPAKPLNIRLVPLLSCCKKRSEFETDNSVSLQNRHQSQPVAKMDTFVLRFPCKSISHC